MFCSITQKYHLCFQVKLVNITAACECYPAVVVMVTAALTTDVTVHHVRSWTRKIVNPRQARLRNPTNTCSHGHGEHNQVRTVLFPW